LNWTEYNNACKQHFGLTIDNTTFLRVYNHKTDTSTRLIVEIENGSTNNLAKDNF
jgi:hypothetical protein